ncbi:DUF4843 domain-containing protein [Ancylomarina sp. DW003]|nr:DUF4843 domain-containing protein [Ancylomarina sp. DW003]MDE5422864.1 DUF4843 domain-containing protein [Ancylomarina sp. DW003]
MKKINLIMVALLFHGLFSCTQDDTMTYGDLNYIYFEEEAVDGVFPSTYFSFVFEEDALTEKMLELPVIAAGKLAENDRLFSYQIVDSLTTAVEGVHFTIDPASQIMPANAVEGNLLVKLLKTADMETVEYKLGLEIVSSDLFTAEMSTVMEISFSNFFAEPDWWYDGSYYNPSLGAFTQVKGLLWLEFMGVTDGSNPWAVPPFINEWGYGERAKRQLSRESFIRWLEVSPGAPYYDENGELVLDTLYES